RGAGGRLATRRTHLALFNHGCPADAVAEAGLSEDDAGDRLIVDGRFHEEATDTPGSPFLAANSLVKEVLAGRPVRCGAAVERLEKHRDVWQLFASSGEIL